ncbi:hypothetical protein [Streptomyces sp. NPDC008137]
MGGQRVVERLTALVGQYGECGSSVGMLIAAQIGSKVAKGEVKWG